MRREQGRMLSGAEKPAKEFDPEAWRYNELSPPSWMASTRRRFSQKKASFGAAQKERSHGSGSRSLCRAGCSQEKRIRVRDLLRGKWRKAAGEAKLRDHDSGSVELGGLAARGGRDSRRDGRDGSLLAAGMGASGNPCQCCS